MNEPNELPLAITKADLEQWRQAQAIEARESNQADFARSVRNLYPTCPELV